MVDLTLGAPDPRLGRAFKRIEFRAHYPGGHATTDEEGLATLVPPFRAAEYTVSFTQRRSRAGEQRTVDTRKVDEQGRVTAELRKK